jgi:hypothetical protein
MPERKWFKDRPIRRTKRTKNGLIKIIFDDGAPGVPGDVTYVEEKEYTATDEAGRPLHLRREFFKTGTQTTGTVQTAPASADGQQ